MAAPKTGIELGVLGSSGLTQSSGQVREEWNRALAGAYGPKVWREMADNCPVCGRGLRTLKLLQSIVPIRVVDAGEDDASIRAGDFLRECLDDLDHTWESFDFDASSCLEYGHSLFECELKFRRGPDGDTPSKYNDGLVGWAGFRFRKQESRDRWEFGANGNATGFWQTQTNGKTILIPLSRCLLFTYNSRAGNPEGTSILRNAYVDYRHRKYVQQFEGIGVEHDFGGILDIQVPPNIAHPTTAEEQRVHDSYVDLASSFKQNERSFLLRACERDQDDKPTGYKVGLIGSPGSKQYDTDKIIRRCDSRIAIVLHDEISLMGQDRVGSFALADSKTSMVAMAVGSLLDNKVAVFNKQGVATLMRINGFAPGTWPHIEHGDIEKVDPQMLANAVASLTSAGILTPDIETENRMRENLDLPLKVEAADGEDVGGELMPSTTPAGALPGTGATTEQTESLNNLSLALQRLVAARTDARNAGDNELAAMFSAKIGDILARM